MGKQQVSPRKQAARDGCTRYEAVSPCQRCGGSTRYTSNGQCVTCNARQVKEYNEQIRRELSDAKAAKEE